MSRLEAKLQTTDQAETDGQNCRFAFTAEKDTTEIYNMSAFENNRFSVHVMKTLNTMRENGEFCDLVFELNNAKFSAHQLILAVWSPLLKNLLQCQSTCLQHVRVTYDRPEVFHKFITFLYTGVLPEMEKNCQAVLLLAATFQIHLLTELCQEHLKIGTTVDNVISLYLLGIKFQLTELQAHCVKYLCHHLTEIAQQQELRDLTPTQIHFFLGSENMSKLDPEIKLFLIISWLTEDVPNREQFLVLLLRHIDWSVVAKEFLIEIIQTENFFTSNPSSLYLLLQTLHSSSFSLGPFESHFWSLQQQYSYLLNSVVSSSVTLDADKPKQFQPLSFSLVFSPIEEQSVFEQERVTAKEGGIKSELQPAINFSEIETRVHHDTICSEVKENHVSLSANISVVTINTSSKGMNVNKTSSKGVSDSKRSSKDVNDSETSSQTLCSQITEMSMSTEETSIANDSLTPVEGSMKRKRLRPHKIITNSDKTKSTIQKVHQGMKKKNIKKHNTREQLKTNANELCLDNIENLTEDQKTKDDSGVLERCGLLVEKKIAVMKKENVKTRKIRKQLPGTVKAIKEIYSNRGSCKQSFDVKEAKQEQNVPQEKVDMTSMDVKRAKSARKTKSNLRKNLFKANPKTEARTKKDIKLQLQKCSECEFTTSNRLMLKKHQKQVHEGSCLFCCSLCSFKSKWSKEYYDHMKQNHFPGPPFQCDEEQCEFNTHKFQELILHRKQHSDQRPFVCDICLTAFRNKSNLYQHFKIHSDEKKFECPECGRCFKLKNTLEQHMVTHSDLRPYLCDLCGFSTKFQSHLISHQRIHTGDVNHCSFPSCTYTTPKKSQLKSHMRSHLGIRRHVCSTCGKAFVEKSHLIRHERTHSSERAYVCKECSYSSTRADKLREHIQKHHSEEALKAKATRSASKKLDAAGKGKVKKIPKTSSQCKDGVDILVSNTDSLIEVVVMKNISKSSRPNNCAGVDTALPNIITTSDVDARPCGINERLVQVLPFESLVSQECVIVAGTSLSIEPTVENVIRNEFNGTAKTVKEKSIVEIVAETAEPLVGINTLRDTGFVYQMQENIGEVTVDDNATMVRRSKIVDKAATTAKIISQHYHHHTQNTNLLVPSYSMALGTSSQFSQSLTDIEQPVSIPHQTPHGSHDLIRFPDTVMSSVTQQFYHPQQHQNHDQEQHDQQQLLQELQRQTHFSSVGDYLY